MKQFLTIFLMIFTLHMSVKADHGPRFQFVNNSPDPTMSSVDIIITLPNFPYPVEPTIVDLGYKEASQFITFTLIYGSPMVYVLPSGSIDTTEYLVKKSLAGTNYYEKYVFVISGDLQNDNLECIFTDGNDEDLSNNRVNVKLFNGAVDAPSIDVSETSIPLGLLFSDINYGQGQGYNLFYPQNNVWQVNSKDGTELAEFSIPLGFFANNPLFVTTTGYLDTVGTNSNNSFKLLAIKANGEVYEISPNQGSGSPRLQLIHSSADESAASVDIWLAEAGGNPVKILENFQYKDATPYIDIPTAFTVYITPAGSTNTAGAVYSKSFTLAPGSSNIFVAAGILEDNFGLYYTQGSEETSSSGSTDLKVFHGSASAPTVDIDEVSIPAGVLVDNLSFGSAQGYLSLASMNYDLQVITQTGLAVGEFNVPLSIFEDSVLVVVATGNIDTIGITPDNPFKLLAITPSGLVVELEPKETLTPAKLQIIHNSATPALDFVDIYLDNSKILDDFEFRTATSFIEVPGATRLKVDVDVRTSLDNSFPIYTENIILSSGRTHVLIASGVKTFGSETYIPMKDFQLIPLTNSRENATSETEVDVKVFHGATDVPAVDVNELTVPVIELVDDILYGEDQGYFTLNPAVYDLEVTLPDAGNFVVNTYRADITGLNGEAVTILASGFINPIKNNSGPDFGLWLALPEGGDLIELPTVDPGITTARVQVIHNSADDAASVVDVWLNDALLLDDFSFRTASPFIDAPAGEEFTIAIKGPNSQDPSNPIWSNNYTLQSNKTYVLIANGIVSSTGYNPSEPFNIYVNDMGRESANSGGNTDVLVFHGSTDAPAVDVVETGAGAGILIDDITYGDYRGYLELPTNNYQLSITDESGTATVAVFDAPLASLGLQDAALVAVASGFLNPMNNNNGPEFGLWVALPSGGDLIPLPNITDIRKNYIDDVSIRVYPNPASSNINVEFDMIDQSDVDMMLYDVTGNVFSTFTFKSNGVSNFNANLNLDGISSGMYFLRIQAKETSVVRKVQILY